MERYSDICELIGAVSSDIDSIAAEYEKARVDEELLVVLRPKIKSCFENLRSSLEYSAQDIWRSYTSKKNSVYFPYGKNEEDFNKSVKRNLPALKEQAPSLYCLIENMQPHVFGSNWLYELCIHTNFNKHDRLGKQVRKNSPSATTALGNVVKITGQGSIIFQDCYSDGIPIGTGGYAVISTERSVADMTREVGPWIPVIREFDWVEFEIDGSVFDVLNLIKISHTEITRFVEAVRSELSP